MLLLGALLLLAVALIVMLTFLLGFRLGGHSWIAEVQRVRAEAAAAERELHRMTRTAFITMADEANRRRDRQA